MELHTAGENAQILYLGKQASPSVSARIQAAAAAVEEALGSDLIDLVPSYASLLILFDPLRTDHMSVRQRVHRAVEQLPQTVAEQDGRCVVLPVYYATEAGADLDDVASARSLSVDELIALHTGTEYRVYAIGFAPGFAYLGEIDKRLATPRLATPRKRVPRGTVAIADRQTAVYPAVSPGGWNLIGRCPLRMFDPDAEPSMPVSVGDSVRFEAIDRDEYLRRGGELN